MEEPDRAFERTFGTLIPEGIVLSARRSHCEDLALAEERALTTGMVEVRRNEFLTGRHCARQALRRLGVADVPIVPAENRAPVWPPDVVGSISHTRGFCAAAVGRRAAFFGVGIDVERARGVSEELERYVAKPGEIARHAKLPDWRTVLFSAKESVFKCVNPASGIWLEFHDVELLEIGDGRFLARASPRERLPFEVEGTFLVSEEFVASAVIVAAGSEVAAKLDPR